MEAISAPDAELMTVERIFDRAWMVPLGTIDGGGGRVGSSGRGMRNKYRRYDYGHLFQRDTRHRCGDGGPYRWDDTVFLHPDGSMRS